MSQTALEKMKELQGELNGIIVEREDEIEGSLAALIAGVHVLFLGPPGTAKSLLANNICKAIDGGTFFQWLLTKFSTPEELFGPYSLKGLENDEYRRITTNKLPEAVIAFLDEIFKANSAILNTLLTLINEREFHNNGGASRVPLLSCFGASNELPQGEELGALYDRFLLRYWITEIQDDVQFKELLKGDLGSTTPKVRITIAEIAELKNSLKNINISDELLEAIREIQLELKSKGVKASDRRWKTSMNVLRAFALLRGQTEVTSDELEVLADILWAAPEDRKTIFEVVSPKANPLNLKAIEYLDAAKEVFDNWKFDQDNDNLAIQAHGQIKEILKNLNADLQDRPDSKTRKLKATKDQIVSFQKSIQAKILG
jgi:MoxR-like ATPase